MTFKSSTRNGQPAVDNSSNKHDVNPSMNDDTNGSGESANMICGGKGENDDLGNVIGSLYKNTDTKFQYL